MGVTYLHRKTHANLVRAPEQVENSATHGYFQTSMALATRIPPIAHNCSDKNVLCTFCRGRVCRGTRICLYYAACRTILYPATVEICGAMWCGYAPIMFIHVQTGTGRTHITPCRANPQANQHAAITQFFLLAVRCQHWYASCFRTVVFLSPFRGNPNNEVRHGYSKGAPGHQRRGACCPL